MLQSNQSNVIISRVIILFLAVGAATFLLPGPSQPTNYSPSLQGALLQLR